MALTRSRRDAGMNYWPGFVDALSTLVLSVIFLLTIFMVAQFVLSQQVAGKNTALSELNAQISRLSQLLSLERTGKTSLEDEVAQLHASLSAAEGERDRLRDTAATGQAAAPAAGASDGTDKLNSQLDLEKTATARAVAQIENLNQQISALRRQIGALEDALGASEKKESDSQLRLTDLGQRLNVALAQRVQELSRYRSDFFGKLRDILGNRPDIHVVGDRFVFQSEVFFDSGTADLRPEGRVELDQLASAVLALEKQIPPDINWVLRVDGHTDIRPVAAGSPFKSNWELSSARAISVVQYLIGKGVSPQRLVAAGFGEFQPIDPGTTEDAFSKNRRIELKLTER
jgi:chemotaxis protein MotB